jgi:MerR family transcriptional regulator, light-induced transcriptional regulator
MYNIKQAAARAGVTVPVLRAWERRYGIVAPERSPSGYRRFDDEAVARVRSMRLLVDDGWSPSAAAAAILAGTQPVQTEAPIESVREGDGTSAGPSGGTAVGGATGAGATGAGATGRVPGEATELSERLVAAARNLDAAAVGAVLDDLFSRGSFERVAADLLFPALRHLGDAWAGGVVTVAGEHLASGAVQRRLALALEAAGPATPGRPGAVVGLPPGSRHELGALAFAVAARRAGLGVTYLGADLPVGDWVAATATADAAVIGVATRRDRRSAREVVRALREARPSLIVAVGGDAAPATDDVLRLPNDLRAAVATLVEAIPPPA